MRCRRRSPSSARCPFPHTRTSPVRDAPCPALARPAPARANRSTVLQHYFARNAPDPVFFPDGVALFGHTLVDWRAQKRLGPAPCATDTSLCVAAQPTDCARLVGPSYANFWSPYRYSRYVQDGKHVVLVNGVSGYRTSRYVVTVYTCDGSEVEREVDSSDSARPLLTAPGLSLIVRQVGRDPSSSPSRVAVCYV